MFVIGLCHGVSDQVERPAFVKSRYWARLLSSKCRSSEMYVCTPTEACVCSRHSRGFYNSARQKKKLSQTNWTHLLMHAASVGQSADGCHGQKGHRRPDRPQHADFLVCSRRGAGRVTKGVSNHFMTKAYSGPFLALRVCRSRTTRPSDYS